MFCEDKQLVWEEEAPEAYKDVWDVGEDLVAKGCCESWGWCLRGGGKREFRIKCGRNEHTWIEGFSIPRKGKGKRLSRVGLWAKQLTFSLPIYRNCAV